MIVGGAVWPDQEPREESRRQMRLCVRNQCLLARSFADAGFVPVLDDVVVERARLGQYRQRLAGLDLHLVVLHPGREEALRRDRARPDKTVAAAVVYLEEEIVRELCEIGLWVESAALTAKETVRFILGRREQARLD